MFAKVREFYEKALVDDIIIYKSILEEYNIAIVNNNGIPFTYNEFCITFLQKLEELHDNIGLYNLSVLSIRDILKSMLNDRVEYSLFI